MNSPFDSISHARVVSVNVGVPRTVEWLGQPVTSSIWKEPVSGPVALRGVNLAGDDQADRKVHGGPDMAVYAYGLDDYRYWQAEFGLEVEPGLFGENLTVEGLNVSGARVGERWQVGSAVLEVSQPRIPCYKLGMRLQDPAFPRRFAAVGRPGTYLRIVREGVISAGDAISVVHRPEHEVSSELIARAYHADRSLLPRLLQVPELSASWREWVEHMLEASATARR
jgi:MOSC domain-containing protein YiiM